MPITEKIASLFKPKTMSCRMPHMLQNKNDDAKTCGAQGTMAGKVWFGGRSFGHFRLQLMQATMLELRT
jgi:hypothetical protein